MEYSGLFRGGSRLNFYWTSWKDAQHSLNIKENQKIFITIYDTTRTRGDNNRRCLYLEGVATEVDQQEEIEKAISLLYPQEINEYSSADFTGSAQRRIYKAVALKGWLNDISEKQVTKDTVKMRVEIDLLRLSELYKD